MNINPNLFISLLLAIILFALAIRIKKRLQIKNRYWFILFAFVSALPGLSMIIYYFHLLATPQWYIYFRVLYGVEISTAFIGLFFGSLADTESKFLLVFISILLIIIPFIKPIIRPLKIKEISEWKDDVCIQSTAATCGPSSLATILRYYNIETSEVELAKNAYACSSGTEIWYLLRCATQKGLSFTLYSIKKFNELKFPSIIGTKLTNIGHFLTVLGKSEDKFIIGDPLLGKKELSEMEFAQRYQLAGLMITFKQ